MKLSIKILLFCLISSFTAQAQNFSLRFDGSDDYAIFPRCEAMLEPSLTIEGWFKCQTSSIPQVILMSFYDIVDKNANVTLEVRETGLLRFNYRTDPTDLNSGENLYSTTVVGDNSWHHFAAVKESDTRLWLYIDGFPEAIACGSFFSPIGLPLFEIGRNRYDDNVNYRAFKGNMDDLKIWNRAKNCREVFNDYTSESSGLEPGLFNNYKFDINLDTLYDCSPEKNHGLRKGIFGPNNLPQFSTDIPTLTDKMCEVQLLSNTEEESSTTIKTVFVSPNPVTETLTVELIQVKKIKGQIFSSDGRLMREVWLSDKINAIDVSTLPSGAYVLKLGNDRTFLTESFIKQ